MVSEFEECKRRPFMPKSRKEKIKEYGRTSFDKVLDSPTFSMTINHELKASESLFLSGTE
jgi:hypothetical protein